MALGALAVVLTALNVVLAELVHQLTFLGIGPGIPVFLIYAGVGVVIARHQPRNPVAWVLIGFVLLAMLSADAGYYAVYCYRLGHHGLPLAGVAAALVPLFLPGIALFPLVILLFPDGRLTSPRWRWVLVAYAGLVAWVTAATLVPTIAAIAGHHVRLDSTGDVIDRRSPGQRRGAGSSGDRGRGHLARVRRPSGAQLAAGLRRAPPAAEVARLRRRDHPGHVHRGHRGRLHHRGGRAPVGRPVALPLSIGVGILKYRLYEIDRIISRTLAYALVTGLLIGVYAGLVLLATQVLSLSSPVAVAVSTLAAAALFAPLRRRVQRIVDRRFNRARYDADRMVAEFAARLKDTVDLDTVRIDLAGVVHRALEPAHASVWVSHQARPRPAPMIAVNDCHAAPLIDHDHGSCASTVTSLPSLILSRTPRCAGSALPGPVCPGGCRL